MRNPLLISPFIPPPRRESKLANDLKHEGIRVGEIIAYRAWRVVESTWMRRTWMRRCDNRLHSVLIKDYVWLPDEPASGDVAIRQRKNLGEIVEHEAGYRSQFAKIVSLDYGDPELLEKFRAIYGLNAPTQCALGQVAVSPLLQE
jgi:hypothetical protein